MSEKVPEKIDLTLDANSENEYEEDDVKYDNEDMGNTFCYIWCIKCEENFGVENPYNMEAMKKKWLKLKWKCESCKPKEESIYFYEARSGRQSYELLKKDVENDPYKEPYSLCNKCFFLHDDNYEGKCKGVYECNGVGDVSVYYGYNYENAKQLERELQFLTKLQLERELHDARIDDADDDDDEDADDDDDDDDEDDSPSPKKQKVIDLTCSDY